MTYLVTDRDYCDVHLINRGITINDNTATFEWEGTGPDATVFHTMFECTLDDGNVFPCEFHLQYKHMQRSACTCYYYMQLLQ